MIGGWFLSLYALWFVVNGVYYHDNSSYLQVNVGTECELQFNPHTIDTRQTHLLDSMHPCLNVDEIVRLIAHELVAPGGEATAAGLACSCKSIEDLVLDTL